MAPGKRFPGFLCRGLCGVALCLILQGCPTRGTWLQGSFEVFSCAVPLLQTQSFGGTRRHSSEEDVHIPLCLQVWLKGALPAQGPERRQPSLHVPGFWILKSSLCTRVPQTPQEMAEDTVGSSQVWRQQNQSSELQGHSDHHCHLRGIREKVFYGGEIPSASATQ